MLKCKDVTGKATDYVDKELSRWQAMGMALHLLICGDCRRFMHYFRLSLKLVQHKSRLSRQDAEALSSRVLKQAGSQTD